MDITPAQFDPVGQQSSASAKDITPAQFDPIEQPVSEALKPTTFLNEATRPLRTVGEQIYQGGKAAFAPQYTEPNTIDKLIGSLGLISPEQSQKYISTPASQLMGLVQMLGAVPTAVGKEVGIATDRASNMLGLPESPTRTSSMNVLGAALTPAGIANAPLNVARSIIRAPFGAATNAITRSEAASAGNQALNASRQAEYEAALGSQAGQLPIATATAEGKATALTAAQQARMNAEIQLRQATAQLDNVTNRIAQRQGIAVTSPFQQTLAAPVTNEQAYSFLKAVRPEAIPSIKLTKLEAKAQEILHDFENVPKALQPSKVVKTAEQLLPEEAGMTETLGGVPTDLNSLTDLQKQAFAPLLKTIQAHNAVGGIALDKMQPFKEAMGQLTQATGARKLGSQLYRSFMDDLRTAAETSPAAAQALRANTVAAQNFAARDIADAVTYSGSLVDKAGRIQIKPGSLMKAVSRDELLSGLPPAKQKEFADTIEEVFRANRNIEQATSASKEATARVKELSKPGMRMKNPELLPEIVSPSHFKKLAMKENVGVRRLIGSAAGATGGAMAAHGFGLPPFMGYASGSAIGYGVANKLAQGIFEATLRPGGSPFVRALFRDMPPMASDVAKLAAITNFLASQQGQEGMQ